MIGITISRLVHWLLCLIVGDRLGIVRGKVVDDQGILFVLTSILKTCFSTVRVTFAVSACKMERYIVASRSIDIVRVNFGCRLASSAASSFAFVALLGPMLWTREANLAVSNVV